MKSNKWIIIGGIVALFLVVSGITYAYFFAKITGNEKTSTINLEAGTLEIVLDGGNSIVANSIIPSSTPFATKNFTVIGNNDSNGNYMPYSVKLIVDDNTYSIDAISYTLEGTNTSNSGEIIENKPNTKVNYSDIIGSGYFTNGSNLIHTYTIKFYFLDNNTDQSADMRANFAAHIEITGGRASKNKITVNFDPDGGELATLSKEVVINGAYGDLPTPTKEGYEFLGWNGKNLALPLNEENYLVNNYNNLIDYLFISENCIRINGYGNERIDTAWAVRSNKKYDLQENTLYNLNFDIRSKNSIPTQYINGSSESQGVSYITGFYNDSINIKVNNSYIFDNDGKWHNVSSALIINQESNNMQLNIGNDLPDIYGEDSYIDISNIQLEEGTEATEYEPYYIDKYTKVVQYKDHTLKAIWKATT